MNMSSYSGKENTVSIQKFWGVDDDNYTMLIVMFF